MATSAQPGVVLLELKDPSSCDGVLEGYIDNLTPIPPKRTSAKVPEARRDRKIRVRRGG